MSVRESYVYRNGELVPKAQALAVEFLKREEKRSDLPAPMIMRDIQPYRSTIDGSMITSRSEHRDHLRAHGCIEVGNELPKSERKPEKKGNIGSDIKEAIEQLRAGYVEPPSIVGQRDEENNIIEAPVLEPLVVSPDIKNGDLIRTEAVRKTII